MPLEQQKEMEKNLPSFKTEVSRLQAAEQQLRSELASLSNVIGSEQSQWTDFSNRLDDLERSLPSRR
jgi:septal ring factor EnvC (AmiA/AmiB activator)